jgi:hypothetical protein
VAALTARWSDAGPDFPASAPICFTRREAIQNDRR